MIETTLADESVVWPSYVDFLSCFAFILILFVSSTVYLISGVEREEMIRHNLEKMQGAFKSVGFDAVIEGHKLRVPLRDKVVFEKNEHQLDDRAKLALREAGRTIGAHSEVKRIIVQGYADKLQPKNNPFFNWQVSVDRAQAVLGFLYTCSDCGYDPEVIRRKLVLRGEGDLAGQNLRKDQLVSGEKGDRRVDIILDNGDEEHDR